MHSRAPSPVSPIASTSSSSSRSTSPVQPLRRSIDHSPLSGRRTWLPFTLRWYYLIVPTTVSLCLGALIVYLVLSSESNQGLGSDNGSSAILFGWRFTPTLIAVLYAQMTLILFEDMKRTEPFTRLARAPVEGSNAYGTVLQTPRVWWTIFVDVCFRRKRVGGTSWALIFAAILNVFALLVISPLSSALLSSEEVLLQRPVAFDNFIPQANVQLPVTANRDTYWRTISALTRNISTSVWVTDKAMTFPFWPQSEKAQLGPRVQSSEKLWKVNSTSISVDYQCQEMELESADLSPQRYSEVYSVQRYGPYNGTQPMISFKLKSKDGCRYNMMIHPAAQLAYGGGITWSNATVYIPPYGDTLAIGGVIAAANVTSTHMYARLDASEECNDRDIILVNTPWTAPVPESQVGPFLEKNQTYRQSAGFRMRGLLCDPNFYLSQHTVDITLSTLSSKLSELSADSYQDVRKELTKGLLDPAHFRSLSMSASWREYFDAGAVKHDAGEVTGNFYQSPGFSGAGSLLGAMSGFNITTVVNDPNLAQLAARIQGRFFSEVMREALDSPQAIRMARVPGKTVTVEERIVVVREIGITLAVLFFVSSLLLVLLFWRSRLSTRPLHLTSDPASTIGLSLLLQPDIARASTFRSMQKESTDDFYAMLQREKYMMPEGLLLRSDSNLAFVSPTMKAKVDWRPQVIRIRMLIALSFCLVLLMTAILTLNAFSLRSRLSQKAFTYEADVSKFKLSFTSFAPISIAPTLTSIIVGLWWDQLDSTFRILQPFIAMTRGPTPIAAGAGLTYRSKSWIGAAFKAASFKHWILFLVTFGSVLAQVLTVSMSALFEQKTANISREIQLQQELQIRQDPVLSAIELSQGSRPYVGPQAVIDELYQDPARNWMYDTGIQYSFNLTPPAWIADEWSFLPLDLTRIFNASSVPQSANVSAADINSRTNNVTFTTSAIRARLECNHVENLSNTSSWITRVDVSDDPDSSDYGEYMDEDFAKLNIIGNMTMYALANQLFEDSPDQTSMLSTPNTVRCCANGTIDDPQRAVLGYWSALAQEKQTYPYEGRTWPVTIVPKWVVGQPVSLRTVDDEPTLLFSEIPRIQAAQCQPIIETTRARVTVDAESASVISYELDSPVAELDTAWSDVFVGSYNTSFSGSLNISTSFGVLFLDSLLGSADRRDVITVSEERVDENAFVFRDPKRGLNTDLMTKSMYTMVDSDPEALLDYSILVLQANRTLQSFFQHFVANGLSVKNGGYTYQRIDAAQSTPQTPSQNSESITATVTSRTRILHMNTTATYLSTAILIWLISTTLIIVCVQRKYTSGMIRDVQLIADMLVLVAGSDNLLELVHEQGVAVKKRKDVKTMLGWFRGRDGEVRWGVEVVGGSNPVEWVDAPQTGWHVREKRGLFAGKKKPLVNVHEVDDTSSL